MLLYQYYGYRLIQIRSPWERGGWKGDWSNDSRLWSENPEVRRNEKLMAAASCRH